MAQQNGATRLDRTHIVLVPGFGAFDALGQVEYYAGVTSLFQLWQDRNQAPVVLHYFDNLPTAAVTTRAARLRNYLAKRMARGEILKTDTIILVGHSTGGLDIRQLVCDLHKRENEHLYVDGGPTVASQQIRERLKGVVFLSVPHWGTNIADWVHSYPALRAMLIAELRAAVAGSQLYLLDTIEAQVAGGAACLINAEMLLALRDALTEANEHYGKPGPLRTADAEEAASQFALYFRLMSSDFHVIDDLMSRSYDPKKKSPAHFNDEERRKELELWKHPHIRTLSYVTVGSRAFCFPAGQAAPVWELTNPFSYLEIAKELKLPVKTDLSYRICYRACAGGPLVRPKQAGKITRVLGQAPPQPLELWDNDGIVNTVSMLWPEGERVLVLADHLDVVGHYHLVETPEAKQSRGHYGTARKYQAYDVLQSTPRFTSEVFEKLWMEIFDFAVHSKAFTHRRRVPARPAKAVGAAA